MSHVIEQVAQELVKASHVDSSEQETHNLLLRVANGFGAFIDMCAADVRAAGEYNLPISDASGNGYDSPGGRALGVMPYRKDAFGAGLDEYVMDKLKCYTPTCNPRDMRALLDSMRAYAALAGRVARKVADDGMRASALDKIEGCQWATLRAMRALDAPMWSVWADTGKQELNGIESALEEIDGHSWSEGKVFKGQCEHTRNDDTADAYTRNGKAMHAYAAATGSVSERDMLAA